MAENLATELERRHSNAEDVAAFFKLHVNEWIDAKDLMEVGSTFAWRTRVSDCRKKFGMQIDNKLIRDEHSDGTVTIQSLYRYLPHTPLGRPADVAQPEPKSRDLFSLRP